MKKREIIINNIYPMAISCTRVHVSSIPIPIPIHINIHIQTCNSHLLTLVPWATWLPDYIVPYHIYKSIYIYYRAYTIPKSKIQNPIQHTKNTLYFHAQIRNLDLKKTLPPPTPHLTFGNLQLLVSSSLWDDICMCTYAGYRPMHAIQTVQKIKRWNR